MSKLYVAYGSNLNIKQMAYRCPTATLVGTGVIENYELQFKGMPTGAYATIAPCKGKSVPVAVWDINLLMKCALTAMRVIPRTISSRIFLSR